MRREEPEKGCDVALCAAERRPILSTPASSLNLVGYGTSVVSRLNSLWGECGLRARRMARSACEVP